MRKSVVVAIIIAVNVVGVISACGCGEVDKSETGKPSEGLSCVVAFKVDGIHCKACEEPLFKSIKEVVKPSLLETSNNNILILKFDSDSDCDKVKNTLLETINKTENAMGSKFSAYELPLRRYFIPEMNCSHCVTRIKSALDDIKESIGNLLVFVEEISSKKSERSIYILTDKYKTLDYSTLDEKITKAISEAGYEVYTTKPQEVKGNSTGGQCNCKEAMPGCPCAHCKGTSKTCPCKEDSKHKKHRHE